MCEMNGNFLAEEPKNMFQGKTNKKTPPPQKKTEEKEVAYCIAIIRHCYSNKETEKEKFHEPAKPRCNVKQPKARMHL